MGIWDGIKKAGQMGAQAIQEKQANIERYKLRYERLDDESLIQKYKSSTGDARLACMLLLKERGYGN